MPSDFNHIDDFFRKKEEEAIADNSMQDKHWQQMKMLMAAPAPVATVRKLNFKLLWQLAAAIITVATVTFVALNHKSKNNQNTDRITLGIPKSTDADSSSDSNGQKVVIVRPRPDLKRSEQSPSGKLNVVPKSYAPLDSDFTNRLNQALSLQNSDVNLTSATPDQVFSNFFSELKKPEQKFIINTEKDTTIYCAEGSILTFPANAFQQDNSAVKNKDVLIVIQEFYSIGDIVSNKLSTMSNGEALVSGGMLNIRAYSGNKELQLQSGHSIDLKMPVTKFDPQMQLFVLQNESDYTANAPLTSDSVTAATRMNWMARGQKQISYANKKKLIKIENLRDNPWKVSYKHAFNPSKVKSIAKFTIPWNSGYSVEEIRSKLSDKYGKYYDEIKVKREWKPLWTKNRKLDTSFTRAWYDTPFVGDSVEIHISTATRLKYITREDSLRYEAIWQQELENAMKRNQSYADLLQVKNQYDFKITGMGWINCDRFLAYPKSKLTDFSVAFNSELNDTYFHSVLVFKKDNVIMQGTLANNRILFGNIPNGQEVSLICIGVKNGKTYSCVQSLTVSKEHKNEIRFEETTPERFREKLRIFGTVVNRG